MEKEKDKKMDECKEILSMYHDCTKSYINDSADTGKLGKSICDGVNQMYNVCMFIKFFQD